MLAQVFGSTTNSATTNNFLQQQFQNALAQTFNSSIQNGTMRANTGAILVAENELTVGLALVPVIDMTGLVEFNQPIQAAVLAMLAAGVRLEWVYGFYEAFVNQLNPATGLVYTPAEITAITGWNAAQIAALGAYFQTMNNMNVNFANAAQASQYGLKSFSFTLRNTSAAAQNIRIGAAPSFVPGAVAGMLLAPGDVWMLDGICTDIFAIASAVGATLSRHILRTA